MGLGGLDSDCVLGLVSGDCSVGMSEDNSGRYEAVVGRRIFSAERKRAIVAEASGVGVNVSAVARRHNIEPSLLFRWRRQVEVLTEPAKHVSSQFLPVTIAARTDRLARPTKHLPPGDRGVAPV